MAFSVLSAKLHKPQLSDNFISRAEFLKDCHRANVVLVSAQAGSGKSTIISALLSEQDRPYSWYSLDEWDNDVTQFFAYFIAGIKSIGRLAAEPLEQLFAAFQSVGFEAFIRALIHQLHTIDYPFILILDDYHLIRNDQIHQVLRTILEHLPQFKVYGQNYSLMDWKYKYYIMLARVYCSEGFYDLARDCVRKSKAYYYINPMPDDITFNDKEAIIDQAETSGHLIQIS